MAWGDGYERDGYLVTNDASRTRIRVRSGCYLNCDLSLSARTPPASVRENVEAGQSMIARLPHFEIVRA